MEISTRVVVRVGGSGWKLDCRKIQGKAVLLVMGATRRLTMPRACVQRLPVRLAAMK